MAAAKKDLLTKVVSFIAWLTGVIVALAVGFGMVSETLTVMWLHPMVTIVAGWIVVVTTIIGALLAIIDALK